LEVATVEPFCLTNGTANPEELVDMVAGAVEWNADALQALLEAQPVPIYLTDSDGWITFFNRACVDFAGRTPVPGKDRWCVTWRLHTESGAPLPHEECPMAVAVKELRQVRGAVAVAERPDGTRVMFTPYPTPIVDDAGISAGAVNILIDVTDTRQAEALKVQALRCRRLAQSVSDAQTVKTLTLMAADYEDKARKLKA
jgi:PAS domain S-box-containing protein